VEQGGQACITMESILVFRIWRRTLKTYEPFEAHYSLVSAPHVANNTATLGRQGSHWNDLETVKLLDGN
jgi:hypothetical protein